MKNIPIILKFFAVMGIFGLFAIAVAVYATSQMRSIANSYTHLIAGNDAAGLWLARANRNLQGMENAIANLEMSGSDQQNTAAMSSLNEAQSRFVKYMKLAAAAEPARAADIMSLESSGLDLIDNQCSTAIALGTAAEDAPETRAAQQEYLANCMPKFAGVILAATKETQDIADQTNRMEAALGGLTGRTILITYAGIIGGLFFVLLAGYFVINFWVISPIRALQSVMGRLSGGDLQASIPGAERKDEIGGMARAVEVFKQAGLDKLKAEQDAATNRAQTEALARQSEAEREAVAAATELVVTGLATGLEQLAAGALLYRLNQPFSAAYEKLRADFNEAMDKLQQTMQSIAANTAGVSSGAAEITHASDDLAHRTEQQAASLVQTAAALDEITAAVRQTAEGADNAKNAVAAAKTEAESSAAIVHETVSAMTGIETSAKQITNIIGVIDEIAFQTNLLALNAGVEAARAGDAGRGFAVVATEVRALAQRSAEAAKEIKTLISTSGQQVAGGVKLVGETGKALTRIVEQVGKLNDLVAAIAASAREQATGLEQVNQAVNQMDKVTQQNAAMVEQSTAASHAMASEAKELSRLVAQFAIGQSAPPPPPMRPAAKPVGKFKPLPQPAAASGDNWNEF